MRLATFLLYLLCLPLSSVAAPSASLQTEHVRASLVAATDAVVPGQPLRVGLRIEHAPGWHTYWRNPGDSGEPPTFTWQLPGGFTAGEIEWPAPRALPVGPLTNYGYEGDHLLPVTLRVPEKLGAPVVTLQLSATWLVCQVKCIPEEGEFALTLPVAARHAPGPQHGLFEQAAKRAAQPASGWALRAQQQAAGARLEGRPPAGEDVLHSVRYFPYGEGLVESSAAQALRANAAGFTLDILPALQPVGPLDRLHGVLVLSDPAGGVRAIEIDVPVAPAEVAAEASTPGLWSALVLAFLGGLLLNLMPCVFPVLSIKLLGLLRNETPQAARRHAAFYAIGVVASFLALALVLIAMRALGAELGWGFQLQSPPFVVALAALFFVLGLNLSGAFEFPQLAAAGTGRTHSAAGAFGTGVLAVFAASPCTAPFMGAALGFAIGQSAAVSLAVFTALGVGMALPFVLLVTWPAARRLLPRPGAWMARLKQALAFPLYATSVWLAWVLGEQLGVAAMAWLGMALVFSAAAAWLWRQRQEGGAGVWLLTALGCALLALGSMLHATRGEPAQAAAAKHAWAAWSPEVVAQHLAAGRGVFIDFTAAWCVTCQVNKRLVLQGEAVSTAFSAHGVVPLRADWTRRDPAITRALAALGRKGVPVYVVQRPGQAPKLLPEILTEDIVLTALERSP